MFVVILFILDVRFVDVPAGVTQEEDRAVFRIHHPSAVLAFISLARSIQPFLSLDDREVEFHLLGIFSFFLFVRKNPSSCDDAEIRTRAPTSEGFKVTN